MTVIQFTRTKGSSLLGAGVFDVDLTMRPDALKTELQDLAFSAIPSYDRSGFHSWTLRSNPSFGTIGLQAVDKRGVELATIWFRHDEREKKLAIRRCMVFDRTDVPPPLEIGTIRPETPEYTATDALVDERRNSAGYPEKNGRWGSKSALQPQRIITDTGHIDCIRKLTAAHALLQHMKNILEVAGLPMPGNIQQKWEEVFPHG